MMTIKGLVALVGSGEYLPVMNAIDRHLLESVAPNGRTPRVVCLPAAAGKEGDESVNRWLGMGEAHFKALGAKVDALPIIDKDSANDSQYEPLIESADLIYFSGGNPHYLFETMNGSRAWTAAMKAWDGGAVYAGCSAGAMIAARRIPNFQQLGIGAMDGFGILPSDYIMPHFNHAGPFRPMMSLVQSRMKAGQKMVGIDENTALVGKLGGSWKVMGESQVHLLTRSHHDVYRMGDTVPLE